MSECEKSYMQRFYDWLTAERKCDVCGGEPVVVMEPLIEAGLFYCEECKPNN